LIRIKPVGMSASGQKQTCVRPRDVRFTPQKRTLGGHLFRALIDSVALPVFALARFSL
jgi:hypothetical protein